MRIDRKATRAPARRRVLPSLNTPVLYTTPDEAVTYLLKDLPVDRAQRVAMTIFGEATDARAQFWKVVVDLLQRRADA